MSNLLVIDRLAMTAPDPSLLAERRRRSELSLLLLAPAAVVCFLLLPQFYGYVVWGPGYMQNFNGEALVFLGQNALANLLSIALSLGLRQRLDRKIAACLTRTGLVHGLLAFLVLVTHQLHSNQIMLFGVGASAVLSVLFMYIEHTHWRSRIALVGDGVGETPVDLRCERVLSPQQDLRRFDVILTPELGQLSPHWAGALTRAALAGIPVRHLAEYIEESHGVVSIKHFDLEHLPLGGLTSYVTRKRIMDIVLVIGSLPITLPLLLLGMLLVRITMGAPVFFIQPRVGQGGKEFRIYKLRTMRPAEAGAAKRATDKKDNRVTPVGKWLRKTRIDELPQLLNVLKGDMSVIGPRPEWSVLSQQYVAELPAYAYRHLVRPGITGWAQVRGGYASDLAETRTKVAYDLFYIKNLSFALDVQILVRTIWTLLSGSGAR